MEKEMSTDLFQQDENATLEAELRRAIQHRDAAQARAVEAGRELQEVMRRAKELLERTKRAREERSAG
jgi:hypothetical protein